MSVLSLVGISQASHDAVLMQMLREYVAISTLVSMKTPLVLAV